MAAFGPIIAERRLVVRGTRAVVRVTLGTPTPHGSAGDWACPFRIRGGGLSIVDAGYGVDSLQALTTALDGIRVRLDESGLALGWKVGPEREAVFDGETGLARTIPIALGPVFRRRLERLLDRELRAEMQRLERRSRAARPRRSATSRAR